MSVCHQVPLLNETQRFSSSSLSFLWSPAAEPDMAVKERSSPAQQEEAGKWHPQRPECRCWVESAVPSVWSAELSRDFVGHIVD